MENMIDFEEFELPGHGSGYPVKLCRNKFALNQKGLCNNHAKDGEASTRTMDEYWNLGGPCNEWFGTAD
jgi:hypothetical protein